MLFFRCFSRLDSVGQLLSAHEAHNNQYPSLLTQFCSTNNFVGWLPVDHHLLVLLQRSQQQQQCCNSRCCCNTRCCNTLYRSKMTPVQAVIFGGGFPRCYSSSPHPRFDIDTHEDERRCKSRSEDGTYLGLLREVAPAVPSAGRTRARTSCCLRRRDGKDCRLYTHARYQGFDPTFAQGII